MSGDIIEDGTYIFDLYSAHSEWLSGTYHYHTSSSDPLEVLKHKISNLIINTQSGISEIELYGIIYD